MGNGDQEKHTWPWEVVEMSHKQVHTGTKSEIQKAMAYTHANIHTFPTIMDPVI
jgi:hypothetical protein